MSIKVDQVTKLYGAQKALDSVSFNIKGGEIVGFLGPNGAGKSTMMKIISCYLPPNAGTVEVCGLNVMDKSIDVKKKVGYLPEHNPLYLDMYVKEYLKFIGQLHNVPNLNERVDEMIDMIGLGPEQHKLIGALSKGYRQRVGLAQAMIHNPDVLILDEPTSGLDPNQLVGIRSLIKEIGKEKTVMLSTHIMQEVEAICNRVIIINQGEIVADKGVEDIRSIYSGNGYMLELEFDNTIQQSELLAIKGIASAINSEGNKWIIKSNTEEDIRKEISKMGAAKNVFVLSMQKQEQSLEDVFKELTK